MHFDRAAYGNGTFLEIIFDGFLLHKVDIYLGLFKWDTIASYATNSFSLSIVLSFPIHNEFFFS